MARFQLQTWGQTLVVASGTGAIYTDEARTSQVAVGTLVTSGIFYFAEGEVRVVLQSLDGSEVLDRGVRSQGKHDLPEIVARPTVQQVVADLSRPTWDDLRVSLSTAKAGGAGVPGYEVFRDGVYAYGFSPTATESLYFEVQTPHSWIAGTGIRPHVHWSPGSSTNTGSVRWELEWTWANAVNAPGNVFGATASATVDQAASGTPYAHQIAPFPEIDGAGKRLSSVLLCRLSRLGGATEDTFTADAYGISVDFHLQHRLLGSDDEYPTS